MRRGLPVLAAALPAAMLAAETAAAAKPRAEGAERPKRTFQNARAAFIADGDTIRVRLGGRLQNLRLTGINAIELTRYSKYPGRRRGACHGLEATAFVERAVRRSGWKVRLAAQKLSSRAERRLRAEPGHAPAAPRRPRLVRAADGKGVVSLRTTDDLVTACQDRGAAACR